MTFYAPPPPDDAPRCGKSVGGRPCSKLLSIYPIFVDESGSPNGEPFWWCTKHESRTDPEGLAPIHVDVVEAPSGRVAQRIIVRTADYKHVVL